MSALVLSPSAERVLQCHTCRHMYNMYRSILQSHVQYVSSHAAAVIEIDFGIQSLCVFAARSTKDPLKLHIELSGFLDLATLIRSHGLTLDLNSSSVSSTLSLGHLATWVSAATFIALIRGDGFDR